MVYTASFNKLQYNLVLQYIFFLPVDQLIRLQSTCYCCSWHPLFFQQMKHSDSKNLNPSSCSFEMPYDLSSDNPTEKTKCLKEKIESLGRLLKHLAEFAQGTNNQILLANDVWDH